MSIRQDADAGAAHHVPHCPRVGKGEATPAVLWGSWPFFVRGDGREVDTRLEQVQSGDILRAERVGADTLLAQIVHMVGTGRGAMAGVLNKNAEALVILEKLDTLVSDETGTLTLGKPTLTAVVATQGFGDNEILRLGASLERASEHPLAAAITFGAEARGQTLTAVDACESRTGKGVTGRIDAPAEAMQLHEDGLQVAMLTG